MLNQLLQALMPAKKMIDMMTLKVESSISIETVAMNVEARCKENNLTILQAYNYNQIVEEKGFPINCKVYVYDICQAKTASMMLTTNPNFSIFMPCTLSLYEENGKTVISTMNMDMMLAAVKSDKSLYAQASGLFNSFKSLMKQLA